MTAAAEQCQCPVGLEQREVAGDRITHTSNGFECLRGLHRVLVVADRLHAADRQPSGNAATRCKRFVVVVDDDGIRAQCKRRGLCGRAFRRDGSSHAHRFARRKNIGKRHLRQMREQALLVLRAPHRA